MGNTKTPTGDSTGKLTKEQAMEIINKTTPCKVLAEPGEKLPQVVVADFIAMDVRPEDKYMTKKEDKTPDAINPQAAGRKDEGAHSIDIKGKEYTGKPQELNESLKRAKTAIETEESADKKLSENNSQDR